MKSIGNELRRFLYVPWMPASLAVVLGFLLFYFVKLYAGQGEPQTSLLFLLSDRKYHGILYALLALFIFGLDVESGAVDAQIMAGQSTHSIVLRKSVLYFAAVLILNGIYSVVCLHLCNIALAEVQQALLPRLLLDLGAAAVFVPLQFIFRTLQPTLILSGAAAAVFIIAAAPEYEMWYAVIGGVQPWGKMIMAAIIVLLCCAAAVLLHTKRRVFR